LQTETRVGIVEVGTGQLRDATETVPHGVAMQEELARDGVEVAVRAQVRLERVDELGVALVGDELAEHALGEGAHLVRRLVEDEAVRSELVEMRRAALAVERAADDEGVLGLHEREVRAGCAALRT